MKANLSLWMATRHVRAGVGRILLSVVAIALGVALVVAFQLMNTAVLRSFVDTVDDLAGRADLQIVAGESVSFSEEVVERVASLPNVELAVPLVRAVAFPDDGSGELLTVHGVDLVNDASVRLYHVADDRDEVIDDLVAFLSQSDSIVVGRAFAESRGLTHGSVVRLVTPRGVRPFTVRGLLELQGAARTLRGRLVVMDLYAAQRAFTADGQITQIDVVVTDEAQVSAARAAVAGVLPAGLVVEEPAARKDGIRKTVRGFQAVLTAFSVMAVLVGFVICYSRLRVVFEARTWEVGLLRAVGLRRGVVFAELVKESLLLGALGAAIGTPLGIFAAHVGLPALARATAINFRLPMASADATVGPGLIALGFATGLFAAIAAAAPPALRLAWTEPIAALTGRGRETPSIVERSRFRLLPLGLVVITGALIVTQFVFSIPALSHITTALIGVATCALAMPTVRFGSRLIGAVWRRVFGPMGGFAVGNIGREPRRTALTVAILGVGLGAILLFGILGWSFEHSLVSRLSRRMRADLVVSSPFRSAGYVGAPLSEELIDELRTIPGVAVTAGHQLKDVPYGEGEIAIAAFDAPGLLDPRVNRWRLHDGALPDALARVVRGDVVMVTGSFAKRFGKGPGDTLRLQSPHGTVELEVAAVADGLLESGLIMSRALYRATWNDPLISWVYVVFEPGVDQGAVRAAIARTVGPKYRVRIQSSPEIIEFFAGQARQAFSALYLMEAIIFLLVVIAIGDTLAAGIVERTREFGMMRAVGLRRSRLFEIVMLEGAAIALLGVLLAAGAGVVLGVFWVEVEFVALLGWTLDLHFPAVFALGTTALAVVLCLFGSLLPSVRAATRSVPIALRYE